MNFTLDYCEADSIDDRKAFSHERVSDGKDEWLTPPEIIRSLGEFDLDPCSPANRPWDTAKKHLTIDDNGLVSEWAGRVWLNPPYGSQTEIWIRRLAMHGNGIALIFARTETKSFFPWVWEYASGIFFFKGRLAFYHVDGTQAKETAGAPSVLISYGNQNAMSLKEYAHNKDGKFITL